MSLFAMCDHFVKAISEAKRVMMDRNDGASKDENPASFYWKKRKQKYYGLCGLVWEYKETSVSLFLDLDQSRNHQKVIGIKTGMMKHGWVQIDKSEFDNGIRRG